MPARSRCTEQSPAQPGSSASASWVSSSSRWPFEEVFEIDLRRVIANVDPVPIQTTWARPSYAVTVDREYGTAAGVLERDTTLVEQALAETRIATEPETTSEVRAPTEERLNSVASQTHDEYASAPFGLPREQGLHWHRRAGTETRNVNGDDACMDRSAVSQRDEHRKACKNDD